MAQEISWEIEKESGEIVLFSGTNAEESIRKQLLARDLKLSDRCRQHIKILSEGSMEVIRIEVKEWKTIRDYADDVFSLQVLYSPINAYMERYILIPIGAAILIGIIVGIVYNTYMLVDVGVGLGEALVWSIILLFLGVTIAGGFITIAVFNYFHPYISLGNIYLAAVSRALIVLVIVLILGYIIIFFTGLTKKKLLE